MTGGIPDGAVVIPPEVVYEKLDMLSTAVTRMDAKLDMLGAQQMQIGDHETRIRGLERTVLRASGAAVVIGAGLSLAVQAIIN